MPPKLKRHSIDEGSRRIQKPLARRHNAVQPSAVTVQTLREQPESLSSTDVTSLQRTLGNRSMGRVLLPFASAIQRNAAPSIVIQRDSYPYGSRNSTPHVHEYGGDCHLQIFHRGRVRRYNIIQDGQRHTQADDALAAAAGNQTLLDVITGLLDGI